MKRPLFFTCLLLVILSAILLTIYDKSDLCKPSSGLSYPDKSEITVSGKICKKNGSTYYLKQVNTIITSENISATNSSNEISSQHTLSQMLIFEPDDKVTLPIGSNITLRGTLRNFPSATNPGQFDVKNYYSSIGVFGKITNAQILSCDNQVDFFPNLMNTLREYFVNRIYCVYPKREGSILCDLILGEKNEIDAEIKELYQRNGIAHILSISSLHVSILGIGLYKILRKLRLSPAIAGMVGLFVLLFYGFLTGMSLSAVRAIGMYSLKILADLSGRTYDAITAVGIMAVIVLAIDVRSIESSSFLLSFGCAIGISIFSPALSGLMKYIFPPSRNYVNRSPLRNKQAVKLLFAGISYLRSGIISSLAITLTTLPIQLYFYYEVPVYSVFLNLIVLPLMSLLLACGLISILIPGLGFIGTVAYYILLFYEKLCKLFDSLPFNSWNPGRPLLWQIIVYYLLWLSIVLLPVIFSKKHFIHDKLSLRFAISIFLFALSIPAVLSFPKLDKGTIIFLDVGQGDSIITYTSAGEVYLFDGGSSSSFQPGKNIIKQALKYYGLSSIAAIFVSHPDTDHCNGIIELLENRDEWNIRIGELILSACTYASNIENYEKLTDNFEKITYVSADEYWISGKDTFLCLSPTASTYSDINETSECFLIVNQNSSILLTGDIQGAAEEQLIKNLETKMEKIGLSTITLLKVSHHGSKYSTPDELLDVISPSLAIISSGAGNRYGHPHEETLARLKSHQITILRTDNLGAIIIKY